MAQAIVLLIYALGALYMFAWRPFRRPATAGVTE
jgi:hypothetical protein